MWLCYRPVDREISRNFLVDPSQRQVGHPWYTPSKSQTGQIFKSCWNKAHSFLKVPGLESDITWCQTPSYNKQFASTLHPNHESVLLRVRLSAEAHLLRKDRYFLSKQILREQITNRHTYFQLLELFCRKTWGNHFESFLAHLGAIIGLGNVWRFPYILFAYGGGLLLLYLWLWKNQW